MIKNRTRTLIATAIALLAFPLVAYSQGGFGGRSGHGMSAGHPFGAGHGSSMEHFEPGEHIERILEHLGERLELTEAQGQELRSMLDAHRLENEPRWEEFKTATHTFHETMMSETFDETAVRDAARARAAITEELAVSHASLMAQSRTVLTPEQIETLEGLHGERTERRQSRRMHRRWHRRGQGSDATTE